MDEPVEPEPLDPRRWRRADHGEVPEVGQIISSVVYPADTQASVIVYGKMRVEAVMHGASGVVIVGPNLANERVEDLPGRPKDIVGKRGIFWRLYGEGTDYV